jgi:hypothetical protein
MSFEMTAAGESLLADFAGVWLLASVDAVVHFQMRTVCESLVTNCADVGFLTCMKTHVNLEIITMCKRLSAYLACSFSRLLFSFG